MGALSNKTMSKQLGPSGMRGALRRPTRVGVLDPMPEFLGPCPRFSAKFDSYPPSLSSPGTLRIPPGRPLTGVTATFWRPKSHPKFHSIFEGIWTPKMVPKASQNDAKIHKKCMFFPGVFSYRFFFNFGRFFGRFSRRPTLDFTAIYNEFVGCAFFRKV